MQIASATIPRSSIMAPVLALACALLVLSLAQGVTVPLHADFDSPLDAATLSASCVGQGARNVCYLVRWPECAQN